MTLWNSRSRALAGGSSESGRRSISVSSAGAGVSASSRADTPSGPDQGNISKPTFETRPRTAEDVLAWFDGRHPVVVVEEEGRVIAFASASAYRPRRECYAGVAEFSVYVARPCRGRGAGRLAMQALLRACEAAG